LSSIESTVIRVLAVLALVTAAATAVIITNSSGILGGDESAAVADQTTAAQTAPSPEEALDQPAAEGTATTAGNTYEVKPGDSFASIAAEYNTSIARIVELNPNVNPQNLKPGTVIKVP
jgi:lysostaphin